MNACVRVYMGLRVNPAEFFNSFLSYTGFLHNGQRRNLADTLASPVRAQTRGKIMLKSAICCQKFTVHACSHFKLLDKSDATRGNFEKKTIYND